MKDGQTIIYYTSFFPDCVKKSEISPIYKKGDPVDATNYHPTSITSAFSNVFERILHQQITNHVRKFELISPLHFGFRKGVSTANALLFFIESFRKSIDIYNLVITAILHLSKAFDSTSLDILIEKLQITGFDDYAQNLIESFLSNRLQQVKLDSFTPTG